MEELIGEFVFLSYILSINLTWCEVQ